MTTEGLPVGEDDLTAFVDGRLPPARLAAVEAFLAARPDHAERVESDRRVRAALRDRLASVASEPIPARLRVAAIRAARWGVLRARATAVAAAFVLFAGGIASGWTARALLTGAGPGGEPPFEEVGRDALAAHRTFAPEVVHPVEVRADQEAHLTQWLSKRLGRRLVIPDLEADGLRLVGGRLLPAGRDVAAQLMYAGPGEQRLTLYVRCGESGAAGFRTLREGELSAVYWVSAGTGYALSGALAGSRLAEVARSVSRELGQGETPPERL